MAKRRALPKYVSAFCDRHGKEWLQFRRNRRRLGYFNAQPPSEEFWAEYRAFMALGDAQGPAKAPPHKIVRGSVGHLLSLYYESTEFKGNAAANTLEKRRAVLEAFRAKHGHRLVKDARYDKLDAYIASVGQQHKDERGKLIGGPFAAETARKLLTSLFKYAVKLEWRPNNPMEFVAFRPKKTSGFHTWTESEIAQYRAHWALGTKQRLAMELMLWTGKRRSDAVRMGPQHIENGELAGRDQKTGKAWTLPIAPQLQQAIDAMGMASHLCFVPSERGRPYSAASFGNMFREWCDAAGLPHCSAHGLRKAISRRMADEGIGNQGIKAVTLHSGDDEVAIYVAQADQKRLSKTSIARISRAEVSNLKRAKRLTDKKTA